MRQKDFIGLAKGKFYTDGRKDEYTSECLVASIGKLDKKLLGGRVAFWKDLDECKEDLDKADSPTKCGKGKVGNGICPDDSECCNSSGYCGHKQAFCGISCIGGPCVSNSATCGKKNTGNFVPENPGECCRDDGSTGTSNSYCGDRCLGGACGINLNIGQSGNIASISPASTGFIEAGYALPLNNLMCSMWDDKGRKEFFYRVDHGQTIFLFDDSLSM